MLSGTVNTSARAATSASAPRRSVATHAIKPPTSDNNAVAWLAEKAFKFPPIWNAAKKNARKMIRERGEKIGVNMTEMLDRMEKHDWESELRRVRNPTLKYPSYYCSEEGVPVSFHAYDRGNLSMEPALEVELAARAVHANVFAKDPKDLDPEGDAKLRAGITDRMLDMRKEMGAREDTVRDIVDLGCATGLSTLELRRVYPTANLIGLDLSEYFLAVAAYNQRDREAKAGKAENIRFVHAAAEQTGLPSESQDIVSMTLVMHELPQAASRAIAHEAFRILRKGGTFVVGEMNPNSPSFQRITSNPIAYTAFRSTEPYLDEYLSLDLHGAMRDAGFAAVGEREATPRHRTVVGIKK